MRILLVDDEISILKTIGKRLEVEGFTVTTAETGEDALIKAGTDHPDLIVLDLMLPTINGLNVCQTLQQDPQLRHVPIVIFSGKSREDMETKCLKAGAAAYVMKGQGASALVAQIRLILTPP